MRDEKGRFIKGYAPSPNTQFKKGHTPWHNGTKGLINGHWKGKKFSREHIENIKKSHNYGEGKDSHNWKGGRTISTTGYVLIYKPNHPFPYKGRYVAEHRLVMEIHLNRPLTRIEHIHHINEIRTDNRIENLMLFEHVGEHQKHHALMRKLKS